MTTKYNPQKHNRRSIRLKGHDYAGGGLYFVTLCAAIGAGNIFANEYAKEIISNIWEEIAVGVGLVSTQSPQSPVGLVSTQSPQSPAGLVSAQSSACHFALQNEGGHKVRKEGRHKAYPYVVMPDHFHGLIGIRAGEKSLGDYICAFKSRVLHEYVNGVKKGCLPAFNGKIWHRNYYEMIVWNAEVEENISNYVRAFCLM
jgi:putative transposase